MTTLGTLTEPTDLSDRAKQLGRQLDALDDLHPLDTPEHSRVVGGAIYRRLEAELYAEPSYRWLFRNPGQVKLGAGFEGELVGERVQVDGQVLTIAAPPVLTADGQWWTVEFEEDAVTTFPRYTVLDLAWETR